jgi:hypothetical protein
VTVVVVGGATRREGDAVLPVGDVQVGVGEVHARVDHGHADAARRLRAGVRRGADSEDAGRGGVARYERDL